MFRPSYLTHRGTRILRLDYRDLKSEELLAAFDLAHAEIARAPMRSLRILTTLSTLYDDRGVKAIRAYALANKPYVLASAVVASPFWRVIVTSLQLHGRDDLHLFDDASAALDWLSSI